MRALLILVSFAAALAGAAPRVHSQAEIDATLARAGLDAQRPAFRKSGARELEARLETALRDLALDPIVREKTLADGALALGLLPRTPSAEALVAHIARVETEVLVWFEDGEHRAHAIAAFAPATAARNAQKHWVRSETRAAAEAMIGSGRLETGRLFARAEDSQVIAAGLAEAVAATADAHALRAARPALAAALTDGQPVEDAFAALAIALRDRDAASLLVTRGDPDLTVHLLRPLRVALAPADAIAVLEQATTQPALASAALMELGALAPRENAARELLFARLGDRRDGASAAAALAAAHDPTLTAALAVHARTAPDLLNARRAALALHLDGSAAAQRALEGLRDDPRVGADARRWTQR